LTYLDTNICETEYLCMNVVRVVIIGN